MKHNGTIYTLFSLVVMLFLAACSSGGTPTGSATPTATSGSAGSTTGTATATTSTQTSTTAQATLKHVPSGIATISLSLAAQTLTVKIAVAGLAPKSSHPAHIHKGSCAKQGAIYLPLQNVVADAAGNGTSTTTINNLGSSFPTSGLYVNVHNGPTLDTPDQAQPIACGNIANLLPTGQAIQVPLDAPAGVVGQTAMGTAQLSLSGKTLTVTIQISGLEPNTTHPAHIHTGTCTKQGVVLYPLKTIATDAQGNATVVTTIDNVTSIPSSGWYVNIHHSMNLTTSTGFDPIACGNVTVG